ncbi:ABC transporter substrate-binding protein [Plantibacter sp. Mn2098]|uniref:ABC transporter substrate-binding protein n=1 Tax=Plantibacter sp. Mn2098 TaxID=3395266 RepID=UPI003BC392A2
MRRRIVSAAAVTAVAALSALALAGCVGGSGAAASGSPAGSGSSASAGAYRPVTVTSCGIDLRFTAPPKRAVTIQQGATEIMLSLGLEHQMAGTSNLIGEIPKNLAAAYASVPVLSASVVDSQEALLKENPDFVYSTYGSQFTGDQLGTREELESLGVPAYLSNTDCQNSAVKPKSATFDQLFQQYRDIADVFGVPDRAEALIRTQQKIVDEAKQTGAKVHGDPTVLWFYSTYNGTPYVAGGTGIPTNIDELTGTRNVFANVHENWPEVSWEAIAKADPDIIVLADLSERGKPGDSAADKLKMLESDPATKDLTAVKNHHLITVSGVPLDPSSRTVDSLTDFLAGLRALGYVS